jgi:toxin ParE1/3/4
MASFVLTNKAKADLKSIGRYTAEKWGREQRNSYLALLDKNFHELAANPIKGRDCSAIRLGYRKRDVGRHTIFYRPLDASCIEIVRVLHKRMDAERHLSEGDLSN